MVKKLTAIILLTSMLTAKTVTINKGTAHEAIVSSKGESLYVTQKGKKKKVYTREEALSDEDGNDLEFEIDDINFDGLDDIAVKEFTVYGDANIYYVGFLSEKNSYKKSEVSLTNYKLYSKYKTIHSWYKDGFKSFTDLYSVNYENKIHHFVTYENYRADDLCFIKDINIKSLRAKDKYNGVLSCKALLEEHEAVKIFAKVTKKKALLYNKSSDEKSNGMYVIKNDMLELIDGEAESDKVLVRFRGKRVVTKYINVEDLKIVARKRYENRHTISFYNDGKWTKEKANDTLNIQKIGSKKYHFTLDTVAKNAHLCYMEGMLYDKGKYLLYKEDACELKLYRTKNGMRSEDKSLSCKALSCGMYGFVGGLNFKEIEYGK